MTDRELLEFAAKAAGWTWWQSKHGYWNIKGPDCEERAACCGWFKFDSYTGSNLAEPTPADALIEVGFNPLDDDGDALRLAIQIGAQGYFGLEVQPTCVQATCLEPWEHCEYEEYKTQAPYAATRRAIVRAAAEIGRAM